mmetsp:Transcript_2350/g.7710  ORF Transcript_2350/g.7710 Transcript_2350/m.7710 type:complete len:313 (+) Transcript_2350:1131-2069(+)
MVAQRLHLGLDLDQVLLRLPERLLGVGNGLPLRIDRLGDAVVVDDGVDPLQQSRARLRDALHRLGCKVGALEVDLHLLDLLLGEAILVELDQGPEKVALAHHHLGALPRHVLAALEDDDAERYVLHQLVRLGELAHLGDVLFLQVVECLGRVLESRQRLLERRLGLGLLLRDLGRHHVELLLLGVGGRLLLLRHLGVGRDLHQHLLDLLGLNLDLSLSGHQLDVHRVHLGRRLDQLGEAPVEPLDLAVNLAPLVLEHRPIVRDEVEVVLGGHVVVALELLQEAVRLASHVLVYHNHVLDDGLARGVRQVLLG